MLGDAPQAEVPPPTGRKPDHDPLKKTVRDIALSMGVVAGIIFLVLAVSWRPQPDPVRSLDPTVTAQATTAAAPYPILLPRVADGWRAKSARFEPTAESDELPVWFKGWVTPADQFVAGPHRIERRIEAADFGENGRRQADLPECIERQQA